MPRPSGRGWGREFLEKARWQSEARTKTDTGGRGEKPQALERTVVKELGKFTPYVRKKGALSASAEGRREKALGTVYQKHSTVRTRKRMYTV